MIQSSLFCLDINCQDSNKVGVYSTTASLGRGQSRYLDGSPRPGWPTSAAAEHRILEIIIDSDH